MIRTFGRSIFMSIALVSFLYLIAPVYSIQKKAHPVFNASVLSGNVGNMSINLFLSPSPYIEPALIDFIGSATQTLDICTYELDLSRVIDAIQGAHDRGVKVRIAIPESGLPSKHRDWLNDKFKKLKKAHLVKITNNKSGLMHHKFVVADGQRLWVGSFNFTENGSRFNDNNALTFTNTKLAENYTAEFDEIWNERHGKRDSDPTPHPIIKSGDVSIQNLFCPEDDVEDALVDTIGKAQESIYVMAYAFTDRDISQALIDRINAGVKVFVLLDLELSRHPYSARNALNEAGATVRISSNNAQMHHKVIIIDEKVVITGSANLSASAYDKNDDSVIIFECRPLAEAFTMEFKRCWKAKPYVWNKWTQQVR